MQAEPMVFFDNRLQSTQSIFRVQLATSIVTVDVKEERLERRALRFVTAARSCGVCLAPVLEGARSGDDTLTAAHHLGQFHGGKTRWVPGVSAVRRLGHVREKQKYDARCWCIGRDLGG
eukprot:scaffold22482_cov69-Phaeocystis_antarctica.AAC.4